VPELQQNWDNSNPSLFSGEIMGQRFTRKKKRNITNSIIYKLSKFIWASERRKFEFFANREWIFNRLALESWMTMYADKEQHPRRESMYAFIRDQLPDNAAVLDIGCGFGEISGMLGKVCKTVVGIDLDHAKLQHARDNYSSDNVSFICGDALTFLEENQQKYDVLICSHILEHLDDPSGMLRRFKNYFSYIYIEVPDFDNSFINHVRQRLDIPLNYTDADHLQEYDRNEMEMLITSLDMNIEHVEFRYGVMRYWVKVE
jgi:SAM-dependent methyltransferase